MNKRAADGLPTTEQSVGGRVENYNEQESQYVYDTAWVGREGECSIKSAGEETSVG